MNPANPFAHVMEGATALMPYVGYFDRPLPDGSTAKGFRNYPDLMAHLKTLDQQMQDPAEPLITRGFDPIYFDNEPRLTLEHLDAVSATRPIFMFHASGHLATANSAMLALDGVTSDTQVDGVGRFPNGELNGIRTAHRANQQAVLPRGEVHS